jgi:predicted RNA-binding protein
MSTISVQDVAKEVNEYVKNNTEVIAAGVYSSEVTINKYCKTLTAIKGKFPQFHSILTRVVQGYKAEWQELGTAQFKHKMLKNYHHKVNFPIIPSEILNTWLAELYTTGKTAAEHPISKYIMDELLLKVTDDLEDLSQTGVRNDLTADGEFGSSLDGIATQIENALGNVLHPAFKIPLNAITDANILDEIKSFEKKLPKKTRKKCKQLFMSDSLAMTFADQYEQTYGTNVNYTVDGNMKTPLTKLEIVGLPNIPDDVIFTTVDGNMVRLIDVFDKPAVTETQVLDYKLKIFMEFFLGYDFLINQLVYVATFAGENRGLNNAVQNALYYDSEDLIVTI